MVRVERGFEQMHFFDCRGMLAPDRELIANRTRARDDDCARKVLMHDFIAIGEFAGKTPGIAVGQAHEQIPIARIDDALHAQSRARQVCAEVR